MCGRFVLTANPEAVQSEFNLASVPQNMAPRYNIAPMQPVPVITNHHPQELTYYKWGLVPSWSKDPAMGNRMINARSEGAAEKPAFRSALRRRRCIIPADGFYEWKTEGKEKTPMFIHMKGRPVFALAGLWEVWHSPEGDELRTCTILTTEANTFMKQFHDRMPVLLHRDDYALWLTDDELLGDVLQPLLKPYDGDNLTAYAVSKMVNRPGVDVPECVAPVT
jgi:putative SOS response-associated peptidase YedK